MAHIISTPEERGWYTPKEFAAKQHVGAETVRRWLRSGNLKGATSIRRQWRIPLDAIEPVELEK